KRCVNFYQTNYLGIVFGALAKAESQRTQLYNWDVDRLPRRDEGGYIDHFNIHSSPWIHSMIVREVLRACPAETAPEVNAARSTNRWPAAESPARTAPQTNRVPPASDDDPPRLMYRDALRFPPGPPKVR